MSLRVYEAPRPEKIRELFSGVMPKYDLLNHLLSFRMDKVWRERAASFSLKGEETSILDIGTGTGKFLEAFLKKRYFELACAVDICGAMLKEARRCVLPGRPVFWLEADTVQGICFRKNSFDLAVTAFTLRSLRDLEAFFAEVSRVLKPGGRIVLLELTRPRNYFLKALYYPYLRFVLPAVGALFSGSFRSYAFLSRSILNFHEPEYLKSLLARAGFRDVRVVPFSGGAATLIMGGKI